MKASWQEVAQLNDLEKSIDALFDRAGAESGLPDSTFDILYALEVYGDDCSQKELCERCWIGKQTIHSAIQRLAGQGILEVRPGQGRSTRVLLTDAGRALVDDKVRPVIEAEARVLESFAPEERDQLMRAFVRYRDVLQCELAACRGYVCQ